MGDVCERTNLTLLPYHHPMLRDQAETVEFPLSLEDSKLINDMLFSVEEPQLASAGAPWPSAAGMAAPQWGASRRIFVIQRQYFETSKHFQEVEKHLNGSERFVVVINPKYKGICQKAFEFMNDNSENDFNNTTDDCPINRTNKIIYDAEEITGMEGCFSVPGRNGLVRRYKFIEANFFSIDGTELSMVLDGWSARVFQHETDHIEGILYDDSVANKCIVLFYHCYLLYFIIIIIVCIVLYCICILSTVIVN